MEIKKAVLNLIEKYWWTMVKFMGSLIVSGSILTWERAALNYSSLAEYNIDFAILI